MLVEFDLLGIWSGNFEAEGIGLDIIWLVAVADSLVCWDLII